MMRRAGSRLSVAALMFSLAVVVGCDKDATETKADPKPEKPADVEKPVADPAEKPAEAVAATASNPDCVGPISATPAETFTVGALEFDRQGSVLNLKTGDADDEFTVGQLTDIKDWTPDNCANMRVALKWFAAEKVDAIALTGDLGESAESIEKVLREVAAAGVPVLAIAGNRECRDHFKAGVEAAQKDHKNIINMNAIRVLNVDDASVVSLPGYFNKSYIHCAEGCEYSPNDVKNLVDVAKGATNPVKLLLSHGPPKQNGATALDRIHEDVNVGDPDLTKLLETGLFQFGMFGNIQEAGGYATDLSGEKRVAQDAFVDQLYMNPGPIDAVRWAMLDGTESSGMAGVLKIKGKQAKYKVYRIKPGEAKPDACK